MPHAVGKVGYPTQANTWLEFMPDNVEQFPDAKGGVLYPTTIADPAHPDPSDGRIELERYGQGTPVEFDYQHYNPDGTGISIGGAKVWWIMGVNARSLEIGSSNFSLRQSEDSEPPRATGTIGIPRPTGGDFDPDDVPEGIDTRGGFILLSKKRNEPNAKESVIHIRPRFEPGTRIWFNYSEIESGRGDTQAGFYYGVHNLGSITTG